MFNHPIERYRSVVVWGVHEGTHVHIHRHFRDTIERLGVPVSWVDNIPKANRALEPGSLVIAAWDSSHLAYREDVDYCLHNWFMDGVDKVAPNVVYLQVYLDLAGRRWENMGPTLDTHPYYDSLAPEAADYEHWGPVTVWNSYLHVLCQPWGTPVFAEDFGPPAARPIDSHVGFVGSVWDNDEGMGNVRVMAEVADWCRDHGLILLVRDGVADEDAEKLLKRCRWAPSIGGEFQAECDQLPCRGFKNISYGRLGFTNLAGYGRLLGDCAIVKRSIPELFDAVASMSVNDEIDFVRAQQHIVREHTYVERLAAICRALEEAHA